MRSVDADFHFHYRALLRGYIGTFISIPGPFSVSTKFHILQYIKAQGTVSNHQKTFQNLFKIRKSNSDLNQFENIWLDLQILSS